MEFSPLLLLFILNFLLVIELLTISQIDYYLIYIANRMAIKPTLNNLTIWLSSHQTPPLLSLLLQMPASKTTLLHLYYICTHTITLLPRLSIMRFTSPVSKQNSLPLDAVLTNLQIMIAFSRSSLLLTLFI